MASILITALVLFIAYLVRGMTGFGSGLIAIPLLSLQYPLSTVVPLVVLLDFIGSMAQGVRNRNAIRWDELLPLLPFTLMGIALALYLFKSVDNALLHQAMGWFILVFALYQILPLPPLRGSRIWAVPAGLMGGLIGTLFGTGGPFYMIWLSLRQLDKQQTRASFAAYFFVDGSIRLIGFVVVGLLSLSLLPMFLQWLPAAALGLLIGGRVHTQLSNQTFKYLISLVLVFSAYRVLV